MAERKILVVDDDTDILFLIKRCLNSKDYSVVTVDNASAGLSKAQDWIPDLILMDIMLPDITGGEAVQHLREQPATADIPVIFLTGMLSSSEDDSDPAGVQIDGRFYPAVAKPFEIRDLIRRVEQVFIDPAAGPQEDEDHTL